MVKKFLKVILYVGMAQLNCRCNQLAGEVITALPYTCSPPPGVHTVNLRVSPFVALRHDVRERARPHVHVRMLALVVGGYVHVATFSRSRTRWGPPAATQRCARMESLLRPILGPAFGHRRPKDASFPHTSCWKSSGSLRPWIAAKTSRRSISIGKGEKKRRKASTSWYE